MQYENGCWVLKEGYGAFWPTEAYEVTKSETDLRICGPTAYMHGKGSAIGGINLTIRITAPMPEVIRVETYHHKGGVKKGPDFELQIDENAALDLDETESELIVKSGTLSLVIRKKPWSMTFMRGDEVLTKSTERDLAFVKKNWTGMMYDHPGDSWISERLSISVGELIYGLGERFGHFTKNGQTVVIRNEDGGTCTEQAYKNIPFYLSNKGYGVFVNHTEPVEFEVGTEQVSKVGFAAPGEYLDYFVFNGPSMKDVLVRYTDMTGKPALPPQWTFGLWLSTSFTTSYDSDTVLGFVNGMLDRGIPLSVFHFDCCWMREFHWTDFVWDNRVFKDPEALIRTIHDKGIKVCVWINSYIAQDSALFDEGMEKGYFIKRKDGSVWQWDMWQPGLTIVDFTNPAACEWYKGLLNKMMDMGVDCFKTDFGERIPDDCVWYDGSDPLKMHNYYAYLYNKCVFECIEERRGVNDAVVFARSAAAGSQKFPVHWGGDCWSNYDAMAQSLRGGLSFTSSGFGFWAHDIGGFEDTSTPDVYKRWVAFGLLSTHSRLHGSSSYRVPWLYDEEAVDVARFFTNLKLELLPYFTTSAYQTHKTGVPMLRSMVLEFEKDRNTHYLDRQYMLGDSLLVSPIFNEEGTADYYLPAGNWTNYLTGEKCTGNVWRNEHQDYLSIPLWVRENSIIPTGVDCQNVNYEFENNLEFKVFGLTDCAEITVMKGDVEAGTLKAAVKNGEVEITSDLKGCKVRFVGMKDVKVRGYETEVSGEDAVIIL
ncbi:MAG: alpha-xylosidase [Lachnospiraceae bacterium]|nr:alpha-xylosidase [Lachnospiraceae bacterium]